MPKRVIARCINGFGKAANSRRLVRPGHGTATADGKLKCCQAKTEYDKIVIAMQRVN